MGLIGNLTSRLSILKFYFKYVKFGMLFIVCLSFLTGVLESIGVSMIFPILQSVLENKPELETTSFPIVGDVLTFFSIDYTINNLVIIFVVLFLFKAVFKFVTGYFKLYYSSKFLLDVRKDMIKSLSGLEYSNYTKRETGKLSSTFTLEVENMVSGFI